MFSHTCFLMEQHHGNCDWPRFWQRLGSRHGSGLYVRPEIATSVEWYPRWQEGATDAPNNQFRHHPRDYIESMEAAIKTVLAELTDAQRAEVVGIGVDSTGSTPRQWMRKAGCWRYVLSSPTTRTPCLCCGKTIPPSKRPKPSPGCATSRAKPTIRATSAEFIPVNGSGPRSCMSPALTQRLHRQPHRGLNCVTGFLPCSRYHPPAGYSPRPLQRGHKSLWHESWGGLPPAAFFDELDPIINKSLKYPLFTDTFTADIPVGTLCEEWATRLGLPQNVAISGGAFDCHMGAVGAGAQPIRW